MQRAESRGTRMHNQVSSERKNLCAKEINNIKYDTLDSYTRKKDYLQNLKKAVYSSWDV